MDWLKIILLFWSVFFFLFGIIRFFARAQEQDLRRRLLHLTVCVMLAIILMEIALWQFGDMQGQPYGFLVHTMQAFSMDAEYKDVFQIEKFKEMEILDQLITYHRLIIYSCAPIIGGAVVLDLVLGFSPGLRLRLSHRRHFYVFSQLNRNSIALAESICRDEKNRKNLSLIFAGCSEEESDEVEACRLRAKDIRAICFPDDLSHIHDLRRAKHSLFFLMNLDEEGGFSDSANLEGLTHLLDKKNILWPKKNGCHIYFFTDQGETLENIRSAKFAFDNDKDADISGEVRMHVIRDYVQSANALMLDHPLFEAISEKEANAPLRVLIVGSGDFSEQMFHTVFWCGQMLDHPLQLASVFLSEEPRDTGSLLEDRLRRSCPELLESCVPGADCLQSSLDGSSGRTYASLYFGEETKENLLEAGFLTKERSFQYGSEETFSFADFDYFILMAGSDEDSLNLADAFWRRFVWLGREGRDLGQKAIAVAVEKLSTSRITTLRYERLQNAEEWIRLFVFGDEKSRFRWERLYDRGLQTSTGTGAYAAEEALHSIPSMDVTRDDIYNEWSNLARQVHLPYKMFSAGCSNDINGKVRFCRRIAEDPVLYDRLCWLEHRRWTAYVRTQGFQKPPHLVSMLRKLAEGEEIGRDCHVLGVYAYKNVPARLHPSLVESINGRRGEKPDLLDHASDMRKYVDELEGKENYDLKAFDGPDGENGPTFSRAEVAAWLAGKPFWNETPTEAEWEKLLQEYPKLADCEVTKTPGMYYVEKVMKLKE